MKRNLLERICGLGTISIYTNADKGPLTKNGIYIHCIENVEEEYHKIKQTATIK